MIFSNCWAMDKIVSSVIFICLCLCCNQVQESERQTISCNESPYVLEDLNEIVDSISYIYLEATDDCLLGKIEHAQLCDDIIVVKDDKGLYVFNLEGKFQFQVSRKGRGPHEHLGIRSFYYDRFSKEFGILCSATNKLFIFDQKGIFNCSYELKDEQKFTYALPCAERTLLASYPLRNNYRKYESQICRISLIENGNIDIEECIPVSKARTTGFEYSPIKFPMAEYDGRFYMTGIFSKDLIVHSVSEKNYTAAFEIKGDIIDDSFLRGMKDLDFFDVLEKADANNRSLGITALYSDGNYLFVEVNRDYVIVTDMNKSISLDLPLKHGNVYYSTLSSLGFCSNLGVLENTDKVTTDNPILYRMHFKNDIL